MLRFQAVLFDFFGTLTHGVRRGAAHRATADMLGCSTEALVEVLDSSFYERASGSFGNAESTMRWVCARLGVHPSDATVRAAVATRHRAVRADTRLRAEAVPVLAALRHRGVRTGLVSDCTHELPAFLPQLAVAPLLDAQVFSVRLGRCKPDPALYLAACSGSASPRPTAYVGDGDSQELTGAERAGLSAVRLAAPDLADHVVLNADHGFDGPSLTSLTDVLDLLDPVPVA
ncbi:HAD family hydrolase [Micromonospora sp. BRA006-A]|nr:HAD family hydrolase [Micromonospora sp. BRA006-A]